MGVIISISFIQLFIYKMFSIVGRRTVKQVNTVVNRAFSHGNVDEVRAEVGKWYKLTIGKLCR